MTHLGGGCSREREPWYVWEAGVDVPYPPEAGAELVPPLTYAVRLQRKVHAGE